MISTVVCSRSFRLAVILTTILLVSLFLSDKMILESNYDVEETAEDQSLTPVYFNNSIFLDNYENSTAVDALNEATVDEISHGPDNYTLAVRDRIKAFAGLANNSSLSLQYSGEDGYGFAAPLLNLRSYYKISPQYSLATCEIAKAMATLLHSSFCFLYDSERFLANGKSINKVFWNLKDCTHSSITAYNDEQLMAMIPTNRSILFMTRHPIHRFMSGFVNKCINEMFIPDNCYSCKGNLTCVIDNLYEDMMYVNRNGITSRVQTYTFRHFAPLSWFCDLKHHPEDFTFVKMAESNENMAEMTDKIINFFSKSVNTKELQVLREAFTSPERTPHATHGSEVRKQYDQELFSSRRLLEKLKLIYHYDFHIFGYSHNI